MTNEDLVARKIFKEQIRRELLTEIKGYQAGVASGGELWATKKGDWTGYIFIIPDEKYQELFKEG